MKSVVKAVFYGLFIFGLCVSNIYANELQTDRYSLEAGQAKSINVQIKAGVAGINLSGGAAGLMDGTFAYNVPEWKPVIDCKVANDVGTLTITQPTKLAGKQNKTESRWDIKLKNDLPISLNVESGIGGFTGDLKGLSVSSLKVNGDVGAIKLTGCSPQLADLELRSGVGKIEADLTKLSKNMNVALSTGTGSITVKLPPNVGVRVKAEKGVGQIRAAGFKQQDGAWVNEAYGKSAITCTIDASTNVGDIVINQEKQHRQK